MIRNSIKILFVVAVATFICLMIVNYRWSYKTHCEALNEPEINQVEEMHSQINDSEIGIENKLQEYKDQGHSDEFIIYERSILNQAIEPQIRSVELAHEQTETELRRELDKLK